MDEWLLGENGAVVVDGIVRAFRPALEDLIQHIVHTILVKGRPEVETKYARPAPESGQAVERVGRLDGTGEEMLKRCSIGAMYEYHVSGQKLYIIDVI